MRIRSGQRRKRSLPSRDSLKLPEKRIAFRIRRVYYDQIVAGTKTEEIRTLKPFWIKRLLNHEDPPTIAVFINKKDVHRRRILSIRIDDPEKVLGRALSEQGKQDIQSEQAIIVELGEVVEV